MKKILVETDDVAGVRFEYYKFNDGTYGYKHLEQLGAFWQSIGRPSIGWSREALEYEHSVRFPE